MASNFERLEVWKSTRGLSNQIHEVVLTFPQNETFSLGVQMKRTADSVVLNIAEGSMGQSPVEFRRFPLTFSSRSTLEVVSCLYLAFDRKYIDKEKFDGLYSRYETLFKQISALKKSLNSVNRQPSTEN